MASCGVRLIRCRLLDPFTSPADAARAMKATLRETGLDKKVCVVDSPVIDSPVVGESRCWQSRC